MRVLNPAYVPPAPAHPHKRHAALVVAEITALSSSVASIDFDALRARLPAIAADLTDGVLHQIALDAGWKVER